MEPISDILSHSVPPPQARLAYGSDQFQFGDLRLPKAQQRPHPVVVVIHGGFWRSRYALDLMNPIAAALTSLGAATWNIEYRRIGNPGGGWPGTFQDVARATDHVRTLATDYPLDLNRVITLGHSAGGQLALWIAGRLRIPTGSPLAEPSPLPVRAAVSLAGVTDLRRAYELGLSQSIVEIFMGGSPDRVPDRYAAGSPAQLLPIGVPQVLLHCTHDSDVPYELSQSYQATAAAKGDEAKLVTLPEAGHFEVIDPRIREGLVVVDTVRSLLTPTL